MLTGRGTVPPPAGTIEDFSPSEIRTGNWPVIRLRSGTSLHVSKFRQSAAATSPSVHKPESHKWYETQLPFIGWPLALPPG
jgi:hypothetical protein